MARLATAVENRLVKELRGPHQSLEPAAIRASLNPALPDRTPASVANTEVSGITSGITDQPAGTVTVGGVRKIDAVVAAVTEASVVLNCVTRSSEALELNLPKDLVPIELQSFGTPVQISLETNGGYRVPVVRSRDISQQEKIAGQAEFEPWVDSL
jgi:hypothetical protein